jgi:DMSO/TMAO reductase YedYZ molybdopterin-dependent catalytic subunit
MDVTHNDDISRKEKEMTQRFSPGGMIVREREPLNLEMPFGSLNGFLTPVEHFFVRSHFAVPPIDVKRWQLKIEGEVERPLTVSLRDLLKMESVIIPVTLECAGNGRAFLTPQMSGAQWERGAVSNAEWTGVRLNDVLRSAGLKDSARELIFEGADKGEIKEAPRPSGKIHYARSMPVEKATDDVLLAFKMNGEDLTPEHGAPVRVIVPGWYGMASVKWLTRIIASAEPFNGYYQTVDYAYWERRRNSPTLVPITEMQVKAQIALPGFADAVSAGQTYRVTGAAWTTEADITKVEISLDGGETWHETRLLGKPVRNAWRLWEYQWRVPAKPGKATLTVRATDSEGRTQPLERDKDRGSYMVNHLVPIEVVVR